MRAAADFVLRRHPGATLAALLVAGVATPGDTPFVVLALVPLYGLTMHRSRAAVAAGVAGIAVALPLHALLWDVPLRAAELLATLALCLAAIGFGLLAAARRTAAARERELLAERAATEERLRIARELHDAVGHDVSLMVVQAQALGATAADEQVREATDAIASLGRRTMAEMHRTLHLLREEGPRAPAPGIDALEEVVDGARAAGADVTLVVEGAPRAIPPALGATAHRIVQEAVTNAIRHAAGAPATVAVRYGPAALELLVTDEGPGPRTGGTPGHGLIGMRERAAAFGGTLETGARPGRGFQVRAVLPYGGS